MCQDHASLEKGAILFCRCDTISSKMVDCLQIFGKHSLKGIDFPYFERIVATFNSGLFSIVFKNGLCYE